MNDAIDTPIKTDEVPKKIVLRCHTCQKKLKMIHFTCKCKHQFCIIHLNPHTHNCKYDYKKEKQVLVSQSNPIIKTKIIRI